MSLSIAIDKARRDTATRSNRARQRAAETRLDEIVKVAGIADDYLEIDRAGDLNVETHFGRLWQACDTEELRTLVARTFAAYQRDEQAEERVVHESVGDAVGYLKERNDFWLNGAAVPGESDGAA